MVAYEESGHLIENDDGTINTKYLRGSIPVSYIKEKRYLYPDFTGDCAIRILYNEEEEQEYDPYTLDDRMGAIYYTLYNLHSSEFKTIMCGSDTLEEAYE
ncbi:MAG: hypothetical protein LUC37_06790 [Prevotella sp.]|nr:hypothetical protein [Prevotella sp.]